MQMFRPPPPPVACFPNRAWQAQLFGSNAAQRGGVIRRAVRDVEREIGRVALEAEVRARGYHMIECGGQFIIICNPGLLRVVC